MAPHHGMPTGHLPVRSYLAVPVKSRSGEVIGGLFFGHSQTGVFTERAERLVVGVAAQAGIAIDNARLYEAAQRAADERKALLESERAARAEAERMSDMKDEFLATLSHELRTPLNAILGWAQVLARGRKHGADIAARACETIERNARVQAQLIEDLLDMSRINSGQAAARHRSRCDPRVGHRGGDRDGAARGRRQGHPARARPRPGAGAVSGDPGRLQQVIWNLLSNAIKFTPRDGAGPGRARARRHRTSRSPWPTRGDRHRAGVPAAPVRALPPGRRVDDAAFVYGNRRNAASSTVGALATLRTGTAVEGDANPRIGHLQGGGVPARLVANLRPTPSRGVNLIALDRRFQKTCCSRPGSPATGPARGSSSLEPDIFGLGRGADRLDRRSMNDAGVDRLDVEPHLAGDDPAHVEQVLDELRLHARVALDDLEPRAHVARRRLPRRSTCDQPRIALSGVRSSCESVARNSSFICADALGLGARGALALEQALALGGRGLAAS